VNEDNLSTVRWEASRKFRNKDKECLKNKINELESNSVNTNTRNLYRSINVFKNAYQPGTNLVKDERGDLLVGPHKILNMWKNYFCQLLNVHGVGGVSRLKCIQPSHLRQSLVPFRLRLLLKS
jgi:hypothetical protein